jgi:hypothetical protein
LCRRRSYGLVRVASRTARCFVPAMGKYLDRLLCQR